MSKYAVLSALGIDRVGIADDISEALERYQINIDESRMATLGGQFAIIMLLSGEAAQMLAVERELDAIGSHLGFHLQLKMIEPPHESGRGLPYIIESYSMDAPGIVHAVTAVLKRHAINIEDLETDTTSAPWTGKIAFRMKAHVTIPPATSVSDLREELIALERERDLDIVIKPITALGAD